ncbi:GNAT family N-acetyltransferase [Allobranchiibius sp. GilTou73]|uniref:GNAT family N-acetyltransferase n=1 Tax=Allobranchiibius sp. GilTou73 TaxID=2904523 RepID=UPI001F475912|nr:GNAT family N-acetyltransferase [Allobranchiibius sp. GilTou73]UIJ35893.1 GNAT family N-acetyltransferase [Allobranchiibius sp. GilTou73]
MPSSRTASPKRLPEPPHLAQPKLTQVTDRTWTSWHDAVVAGFHETAETETTALSRDLFPPAGCFGLRVGRAWVATASSTVRTLSVPGGEVPCAAVSDVTVAPAYRRRGLLSAMMRHQLDDLTAREVPMAALWASESGIYGRFGYGVATWSASLSGSTHESAFLPDVATEGSVVEVSADQWLAAARPVHESVRAEQPGMFDRPGRWWEMETVDPERWREGRSARRYLVHFDAGGTVDGVGTYRFKDDWNRTGPAGKVSVGPVLASTPTAYAGLWRYQLDLDLARTFSASGAAAQETLLHLLADPRALDIRPADGLYLRILDVSEALQSRSYLADAALVLQVADPVLASVDGRYSLRITGGHAEVARTRKAPDLTLSARDLGAVYLGGVSVGDLHRAGRVREHTAGAVREAAGAFGWTRSPYCPDNF